MVCEALVEKIHLVDKCIHYIKVLYEWGRYEIVFLSSLHFKSCIHIIHNIVSVDVNILPDVVPECVRYLFSRVRYFFSRSTVWCRRYFIFTSPRDPSAAFSWTRPPLPCFFHPSSPGWWSRLPASGLLSDARFRGPLPRLPVPACRVPDRFRDRNRHLSSWMHMCSNRADHRVDNSAPCAGGAYRSVPCRVP